MSYAELCSVFHCFPFGKEESSFTVHLPERVRSLGRCLNCDYVLLVPRATGTHFSCHLWHHYTLGGGVDACKVHDCERASVHRFSSNSGKLFINPRQHCTLIFQPEPAKHGDDAGRNEEIFAEYKVALPSTYCLLFSL